MMVKHQEMILRSIIQEELRGLRINENIMTGLMLISMIPQFAAMSDRRLKHDVVHVDQSPSGIKIYEFSFKPGGRRYRGIMAQEILDTHPEAVVVNDDGFYAVRYSEIDTDLEIVPVEEY